MNSFDFLSFVHFVLYLINLKLISLHLITKFNSNLFIDQKKNLKVSFLLLNFLINFIFDFSN